MFTLFLFIFYRKTKNANISPRAFLYQAFILSKDRRENDKNEIPILLNGMLSNKKYADDVRQCFNS